MNSNYYYNQIIYYEDQVEKLNDKVSSYNNYLDTLNSFKNDLSLICDDLDDAEGSRSRGGYLSPGLEVEPDTLFKTLEDLDIVIKKTNDKANDLSHQLALMRTKLSTNKKLYKMARNDEFSGGMML